MTPSAAIARSTTRRIAWRLLPFLWLLYLIAYLDRANVAFANLEMSRDLHFSDSVFGLGAGIFFVGYVILEIPGAGIVVYLKHWVRAEDRAKAVAIFTTATTVANVIGSPIAGPILRVHWLGLS